MKNKEMLYLALQELRIDEARKQKKGLPFIMASVFIWLAILIIHLSHLSVVTKNLFTFFCSVPLVPLAYLFSKLIGGDFQNKENPLNGLGLLFTFNQMIYLLIVMWVYAAMPEKMLMVYAMCFGAHLLPYGWLYQSKTYYVLSIIISVVVLLLGIHCSTVVVALFMFLIEIIFCCCLNVENKKRVE